MFAVVSYKEKQYKVEAGKEYKFDLIDQAGQKEIIFSKVLLADDGKNIMIGDPGIKGASVEGEIIENIKDKKVTGVKFHAKKRYKKNLGHRQQYSVVKIKQIKL